MPCIINVHEQPQPTVQYPQRDIYVTSHPRKITMRERRLTVRAQEVAVRERACKNDRARTATSSSCIGAVVSVREKALSEFDVRARRATRCAKLLPPRRMPVRKLPLAVRTWSLTMCEKGGGQKSKKQRNESTYSRHTRGHTINKQLQVSRFITC